jgi:HB1, ASXL, restriction endonuclease HTH domain/Restriction endonuclease
MTFTDAAAEVLRLIGRPLHYKEITDYAIEKNLLSHVGKSPEVTMGARLAALLKKDSPENPLVRVKPGVFALREWDEKTIKSGLDTKTGSDKKKKRDAEAADGDAGDDAIADEEGGDDISFSTEPVVKELDAGDDDDDEERVTLIPKPKAGAQIRPAVPPAPGRPAIRADDDVTDGPGEVMRAELAAGAADIFDEEDDDDQPILGGPDTGGADRPAGEQGDGRRRRRRRRRGRGGADAAPAVSGGGGAGGLPSYTATPVDAATQPRERNERGDHSSSHRDRERGPRDRGPRDEFRNDDRAFQGPQVIDFLGTEGPAIDDLSGRDFADAVYSVLSTFDRGGGPVSLRQIAETVQRRGRLAGDVQVVQSQVAAAVRADNQRRLTQGQRPRFRFAGGRVALTDWLLGGDLAALEQEALAAVERYREAARRAFARKIGELPGHAFVELCMLALEKVGVGQLRVLRRAGVPGGETHFSGVLRTPLEEVRVGIVLRRDGREVGRERVTELRGALHHYGEARMGFILTAGQVLSGAREEAASQGVPTVSLLDGYGVARLCEDNDVAVIRAKLPVAIPDVDLLEALRAS